MSLVPAFVAFVVITVTIIGLMALARLLLFSDRRSLREFKKFREAVTDETRIVQEVHAGLARMEQRVESLETLLLDKDKNASERARK